MNHNNELQLIKPPWKLHGQGWISMYFIDSDDKKGFAIDGVIPTGPSFLMLVKYEDSPVGTYDELLFIPGKYRFEKEAGYNISHIHVSTNISTINGKENWLIPKQTSEFSTNQSLKTTSFCIIDSDHHETEVGFRNHSLSIPVFTHLLPYRIVQKLNNQTAVTRPDATGTASLARQLHFKSNMKGFSTLNNYRPKLSLYVPSFKMVFPPAKWLKH